MINKRKYAVVASIVFLLTAVAAVLIRLEAVRPFENLRAEDIASVRISLQSPDAVVLIEDEARIAEIAGVIITVITYEKSDEWQDYVGQSAAFTLTMKSGEETEIVAYNPFVIINGQGYKAEYEPCENLSSVANRTLNDR